MNRIRIKTSIFRVAALIFLLYTTGIRSAHSQTLFFEDKVAMDSLKRGTDLLYNFKFDQASSAVSKLRQKYPSHPGILLFTSLQQFWKNYPLSKSNADYTNYIRNLNRVITEGEKLSKKFPKSSEPDFYIMMANLILARLHSEEGEYIKAVGETRKAYEFIKKGFSQKSKNSEYYFSTGLYNYYRVAFPESHPLYNSFTVFFPAGNKTLGIKDLEIGAVKSVFSKAESLIFLSSIFLRDEFDATKALKYSTTMHENYPGNWLFSMIHAECLIESNEGAKAEEIINQLLGRNEKIALLGGYYLKGLKERKEGNSESAKWSFQKALLYGKNKEKGTKVYLAFTYNELAKIAMEEGKSDWAAKYFALAKQNGSFTKIKRDAKAAGF